MELLRLYVLFAVVPMALLLALCFFVMFAMSKNEKKIINVIGSIAVALLGFSALLVFATGVYSLSTGQGCMMKKLMHKGQYMMHSGHSQPGWSGDSKQLPGCGKPMYYKKGLPQANTTK